MSSRRVARAALAAAALALVALAPGCAYLPPVPDAMKVAAPRDTTAATRAAAAPAHAQVDSMPSREAAEVLATIPEPLKPEERVPAPARGALAADSAAAAPPESAAVAPADTGAAPPEALPVPEPTKPLGDAPGTLGTRPLPDSLFMPPPAAPPAGGAGISPAAPAAPAAPDTCFRVQLTAPRDRKTAELKRKAAESLLFARCVITPSSGLYKVRTRDCMTRAAADALRARARASGFDGAFRFVEKTP